MTRARRGSGVHERGLVLVATLLVLAVVAIVVFGALFTSVIDRQVASYQLGAQGAYNAAKAGLARYNTHLFKALVEMYEDGAETCYSDPVTERVDSEVAELLSGADGGGWYALSGGSGVATYRLKHEVVDGYLVVTSVGRYGTAQSSARQKLALGANVNVWDNALFVRGDDPSDGLALGALIYGSVQLVAEGPLVLLAGSGNRPGAGIFANYAGSPVSMETMVSDRMAGPVLGASTWDDSEEPLPELCPRIRVEAGDLVVEDGATVGIETAPLRSVHLGTGHSVYEHSGGAERRVADHHGSDQVHARFPEREGMALPYADYVRLPLLPNDYPDEAYPADSLFAGGTPLNVEEYAAPDGSGVCGWLVEEGTMRLPPIDAEAALDQYGYRAQSQGADFLTCFAGIDQGASNAAAVDAVWPDDGVGEHAHVSYVLPDEGQPYLRLSGWINSGPYPLRIGAQIAQVEHEGAPDGTAGPEVTLRYEGRGVLRAGSCRAASYWKCAAPDEDASMEIHGGLAPKGGFPSQNALGLVSSGELNVDSGPETTVAVLAFAGSVGVAPGSFVAGALVGGAVHLFEASRVAYHPEIRSTAELLCLPGSSCMNAVTEDPGAGPPASHTLIVASYERR